MEEVKKKKKIEISLGMAIFLIALFLFIIVTVIAGTIIINKKTNNINDKNSEKGVVYTVYEKRGEDEKYSYSIPKINIDSEDAKDINKEIEENLIKRAKEKVKNIKVRNDRLG